MMKILSPVALAALFSLISVSAVSACGSVNNDQTETKVYGNVNEPRWVSIKGSLSGPFGLGGTPFRHVKANTYNKFRELGIYNCRLIHDHTVKFISEKAI